MNPTITIFINTDCGPCNQLKKWLKEKGIKYIEKDIVNDVSAAKEFRAKAGQYTPTTFIEIGEEKFEVIGNNPEKIERIITVNTPE